MEKPTTTAATAEAASSASSIENLVKDETNENSSISNDIERIHSTPPDLSITDEQKKAEVNEIAATYGINQRKLMTKIDLCVVPPFCLMYFLAFLDRVNISNAKLYGMETDLKLVGEQFNTALTVFFVPYIIFEILSNYMLKIVKPHFWLAGMIFFFGIVTICMAYSHSFGGLVTCRFLLGIFEAGSFPSIFYIMANFYTAKESQRRFSTFFSCTCLAGGCAGALAYRLNDLDGVRGLASWQWIYIVEGSMTAFLSIFLFFAVADFPEQARFLNENERTFLKKKLEAYSGKSGFEVKQTWADIGHVFKEPLLYIAALGYFALIVPSYSYAYFAPTIIKQLGYTAMAAQAHSIYPWLASMGFSIVLAFVSDFARNRWAFCALSCIVAIVGLCLVLKGGDYTIKYAGCFLIASGLYTAMPILVCWMSLNFAGHTRKSVGTAFVIGFGNIGGIIASFIFPNSDAPLYKMGLCVNIGFTALALVLVLTYFGALMYRNKQKQTQAAKDKWASLTYRQQVMGGDLNPDFVYQL